MTLILYSTGCPLCEYVQAKLDEKKVDYQLVTDEEEMTSLGIDNIPVLSVDGKLLEFSDATSFIETL